MKKPIYYCPTWAIYTTCVGEKKQAMANRKTNCKWNNFLDIDNYRARLYAL